MSYKRMKPAEDELHCEIKALLDRAKATDDQERNEPELDIPAEISPREAPGGDPGGKGAPGSAPA